MEKKKEKCIHDGHRARLLDLVVNAGIDALSDIQAMEFLLTYVFPRGDVNPLAHRLLDEFENFGNVLNAEIPDLMRVHGINERSAKKIAMFRELFFHFASSRMGKKFVVKCKADLIDMMEDHLRFRNTEHFLLIALSAGSMVTHKRMIKSNNTTNVGLSVLDLTSFLSTSKPVSFVSAHCHPYGKAYPSPNDDYSFKVMKEVCETCGVNFIDSYIVGEDGVYSQRDDMMVRQYCDIEQLKKAFKAE